MNIQDLEAKLEEVESKRHAAEKEEAWYQALREYHGEDEVISFAEYSKLLGEDKGQYWGAKTSIPALDDLVDGFREGNLIVVTAPTAQGKTTFCQTLTRNFSANGIKSLWFSYEMPARELLDKFGEDIPVAFLPRSL